MDSGKYRRYSCNGCGMEAIHSGSRGRLPTRCRPCSEKTSHGPERPCSLCGATFSPRTETQDQCGRLCRDKARRAWAPETLDCRWCGKPFLQTNHAQAVCSSRCKVSYWRSRNPDAVERMRVAAAAKAAEAPRKPYKAKPQTVCAVRFTQCRRCDAWLDPRKLTAVLCASTHCQREDARMVANMWAENQHKKAAPEIECETCMARFCPLYGHSGATRCHPCGLAAIKAIRKAAKKLRDALKRGANGGAAVRPDAVFDRDGWLCQLCGVATPKELRGSHGPTAPELDHIKPVSKGGTHDMGNLQCLCRACNSAKGDKYPYNPKGDL